MNEPADGGQEPAPFASAEEYRAQVTALARAIATSHVLLQTVALERLELAVARAEAFGPFLDPTAWRNATERRQLEAQRILISWGLESRRRFRELAELVPHLLGPVDATKAAEFQEFERFRRADHDRGR